MRSVILAVALFAATGASAQTYSYEGSINGQRWGAQTFVGRDGSTSSWLRLYGEPNTGIERMRPVTHRNVCDRQGVAGFEIVSGPQPGCDRR